MASGEEEERVAHVGSVEGRRKEVSTADSQSLSHTDTQRRWVGMKPLKRMKCVSRKTVAKTFILTWVDDEGVRRV